MKKIYALLLAFALIPLQACAQERWTEGEHFKVIADEATAKKEIVEYFSFWCPACYNLEPLVDEMKKKMGDDVAFTKVHVNFMGFTGPDVQDEATRAMMIGRALKQEDRLNKAIFNYRHRQNAPITGLADLKNVFVVNGVDGDEFDKLAKSFGVNSMLKKNNKQVSDMRRHLRAVPTFIVNGKYQATFTRDMTADDMVDLVIWLTTLD